MARIAIIIGEHDPWDGRPYLLKRLAERWRARGHEIAVARGPRFTTPADLAILHVDLTRTPDAYRDLAARYPRAVNLSGTDIRKRGVITDRVRRREGHGGAVIVKTDANHFAVGERESRRAGRGKLARKLWRAYDRAAARLPWWVSGHTAGETYPIFDRPDAVPWSVWADPRFVVQRFLVERADGHFVSRRWYFLGGATVCIVNRGREPVVTGLTTATREVGPAPPPEVLALRARMGLDYGKIDFVMTEGRAAIFDVNRTVAFNMPEEIARTIVAALASGIDEFAPPP